MLNPHIPRLRFSLFAAVFGTLVNLSSLYAPQNWQVGFLFATGIFCYVLAIVEVSLVVVVAHNDRMVVETNRIEAIAGCPADRLNALGYALPELGLRVVNNLPAVMWGATGGVELETFRRFLVASRENWVAPIREWGKSEEDKVAYDTILERLFEMDYVYTRAEGGAPNGPKSWLWKEGALKRLWAEYMGWQIIFQGIEELDA